MHPVLADAVLPFAEKVAAVSLIEAQVSPDPEYHRWCGQQVVEHLILSFKHTREELQRRLKTGQSPATKRTFLQWLIKVQVCFFASMSDGVSTTLPLRPSEFVPQDGPALAARLLAEAEELNKVLSECRIVFGLRPCGYHPMFCRLRVEEWRVYHAVHCRHHMCQFDEAIRFARKYPGGPEKALVDAQRVSRHHHHHHHESTAK